MGLSRRLLSSNIGPYSAVVNSHIPTGYNPEDGVNQTSICRHVIDSIDKQLHLLEVDHHMALKDDKLLHFYSYPREWIPPSKDNSSRSELFLFDENVFENELLKPLSKVLQGFPTNILLTLPGFMVRMQSPRFHQYLLQGSDSLLQMLMNTEVKDPIFEFNILAQCGLNHARIDITSTHRALPSDPYDEFYTLVPTKANFFGVIRDKNDQPVTLRTYSNKVEFDEELDVRGVEQAYNLEEGSGTTKISFRTSMS